MKFSSQEKKIFFLIPYPVGEAPSQRFRFEQYFEILKKEGVTYSIQSFLAKDKWRTFYSSGKIARKAALIIRGFVKRVWVLFFLPGYNYVFIHREAAPIGPPLFEWIIAKVLRKKIIYDFDDAIWLTDRTTESRVERSIRWRSKIKSICNWSYRVSCGNDYLCEYARRFNKNVTLNPTTIDTNKYIYHSRQTAKKKERKVVIGWTGSHSTLKYLNGIEEILQQLEKSYPEVEFRVIADKRPNLSLQRLQFKPWSKETEVQDLLLFDIGLMPLPDDDWSRGKCGFKALQYMAVGVPAVASPVGVNTKIIRHGENGYLASEFEWKKWISSLIENETLRRELGQRGVATVENSFSVNSNKENFLSLFS